MLFRGRNLFRPLPGRQKIGGRPSVTGATPRGQSPFPKQTRRIRMAQQFDLLILGSGSTAFAAALRAAESGKTAVMTESRIVGGTCANRGCLPSKNLIEAARIVYESAHPRYPGLAPAKMGIDFRALVEQKDEIVHGDRKSV